MIVQLLQLVIDLDRHTITGPYPEDGIPFTEWEAHENRWDDFDLMQYQRALRTTPTFAILDSPNHDRRWTEHKIEVVEPYVYHQTVSEINDDA